MANMIKTIMITLSLPIIIFSQIKVSMVKGKVVAADSNFSSMGAIVFLINTELADSAAHNKKFKISKADVYGTSVDKSGKYKIKKIPFGEYIIKCTFIGYKTEIDTIVFNKDHLSVIKNFCLKVQLIKGGNLLE